MHPLHLSLLLSLLISLFIAGCGGIHPPPVNESAEAEQVDFSCSSFYFLWGTHAEYGEQYPEALEAYEKALICDPNADYIREKLPILMLKMGDFDAAAQWLIEAITKDPENTTYLLFLANIYVQQEKLEDAVPIYEEILRLEPDSEIVSTRLGILYTHLDQYDVAEKIFQDLLTKNPESYFTTLSLARLLKQKNEYKEALIQYERALTLNWSKELAFEIGYVYSSQKNFDDALRIYTTITDNDNFDERALLSRIQTLLDLDKFDEAEKELHSLRQFSENPEKIEFILSKVFLQQEKVHEAREILHRLDKEEDNDEARYMLALIAYRESKYPESLEFIRRIRATSANHEEAVYLHVRILEKQEKTEQAIALLEKNVTREKSRSPLFYALLSSLYQDTGKKDHALATLQTAVTAYPGNYQLHFELGLMLEKQQRNQEALVQMEKVLELNPDHADALNFIGYTWADQNRNLGKALEYVLRANRIKPGNAFIIDSVGWTYYRLGEFDKAVEYLIKSISFEPADPHIFDHLGDTYSAMGNFQKALTAYEKAYELFKDQKQKSAVKAKIDAITENP